MLEHILPVLGGVGVEVVDEVGRPSPDLADLVVPLSRLDEHFPLLALLVGVTLVVPDTRLHDGNIPIFTCDAFHAIQGELVSIHREGLELVHVVDVAPNRVQRNSVFLVVTYHCLQFPHVRVAPSALVEPHRPKRRNYRLSHQTVELLQQILRIALTQDEPEIDYPSDSSVNLEITIVAETLHFDIEGIRCPEVADVMVA